MGYLMVYLSVMCYIHNKVHIEANWTWSSGPTLHFLCHSIKDKQVFQVEINPLVVQSSDIHEWINFRASILKGHFSWMIEPFYTRQVSAWGLHRKFILLYLLSLLFMLPASVFLYFRRDFYIVRYSYSADFNGNSHISMFYHQDKKIQQTPFLLPHGNVIVVNFLFYFTLAFCLFCL